MTGSDAGTRPDHLPDRRVPLPVTESREDLLDTVTDLSHDAMDAGLDRRDAIRALRTAAAELEEAGDR